MGYSPFAPGTAASLLALPLCFLAKGNEFLYLFLTVFLVALGFWSSSIAEKSFRKKDPPQIVIDEFASLLVVYLFVPLTPRLLITGFVLFRLFDILKIPPIKKLQKLPGGFGIMLDDLAAALLVNIILHVLKLSFFRC